MRMWKCMATVWTLIYTVLNFGHAGAEAAKTKPIKQKHAVLSKECDDAYPGLSNMLIADAGPLQPDSVELLLENSPRITTARSAKTTSADYDQKLLDAEIELRECLNQAWLVPSLFKHHEDNIRFNVRNIFTILNDRGSRRKLGLATRELEGWGTKHLNNQRIPPDAGSLAPIEIAR